MASSSTTSRRPPCPGAPPPSWTRSSTGRCAVRIPDGSVRLVGWVGLAMLVGALMVGCNPVLDDAIADLGPEKPGVHPGPLHRPGQPCLLCHDGALGDPQAFSV